MIRLFRTAVSRSHVAALAAVIGGVLATASVALGQDNFWQGPPGGDWNTSGNWSLGMVPNLAQRVFINGDGSPVINSGTIAEASRVLLADDAFTDLSTLTVEAGAYLAITGDGRLDLGTLGQGIFTVNGGTVAAGLIRLGADNNQPDAQGTMILTAGDVFVDGDFVMGYGNATTKLQSLTMSGGSLEASRFLVADNAGSTARVDMTGGVMSVNQLGIVTNIDACCPDLTGHFQLDGGTVNVLNPTDPTQGTGGAPLGFRLVNNEDDRLGTMDITNGTLTLATVAGEETAVADYVLNFAFRGILTGYGGTGSIVVTPGTELVTVTGSTDPQVLPSVFEWQTTGVGDWNDFDNWSPTAADPANANTHIAVFGDLITATTTVVTNTPVTVKRIEINSENRYILAGGGQVTLEADSGGASLDVQSGDHEFQLPLRLGSTTQVTTAAASQLDFNNVVILDDWTMNISAGSNVNLNNSIDDPSGGTINNSGNLGGGGRVNGNLNNQGGGTVAPGYSPGTLDVDGNFTQDASSSLLIELAGTADGLFDLLAVGGDASLAGFLDVAVIDGFVPNPGDTFDVLTADNIADNGLTLTGESGFSYSIVGGVLEADFDVDGDVDGDDFLLWQVGFGSGIISGATKMDGDFDNDGDVDGDDFLGWQQQFGSTAEGGGILRLTFNGDLAARAIPEPTTMLLLAIALIGLTARVRQAF